MALFVVLQILVLAVRSLPESLTDNDKAEIN